MKEPSGGEDAISSLKRMKLVNGKDNKSIKFREPNDIQQREQKTSKRRRESVPVRPLNVIPRRENQNDYVLSSPSVERRGNFPLVDEMTERIRGDTETKPGAENFPIEDLLANGFMPFYLYDIPKVMCTVSNELHKEATAISNKNRQLAAAAAATSSDDPATAAAKRRKTKHGAGGGASEALPGTAQSSPFLWDLPDYGYNNTKGKAELYDKIRKYYRNCEERMKQFFIDDQLENEAGEPVAWLEEGDVPRHRPPRSLGMYRDLEAQFGVAWNERLSVLKESASRVPKFDDEPPITMQWIESYRLRAVSGDELCSRGAACKFNTFSKKDNLRYIGRVFETPREVRDREAHLASCGKTPLYVRNTKRLCIDCLLYDLTIQCYENAGSENVPLVQINYFTVLCEVDQYKRDGVMLPVMMNGNGKPTGIVGDVPAYSTSHRISMPIKIQQIEGDNFVHITTNYLAETGMDF